jgi:hypothetical protein
MEHRLPCDKHSQTTPVSDELDHLAHLRHHPPIGEGLTAMRCLVFNAEMLLMEAVPADPTTLPGFEHHTFLCSACNDIERRLLFRRRLAEEGEDL